MRAHGNPLRNAALDHLAHFAASSRAGASDCRAKLGQLVAVLRAEVPCDLALQFLSVLLGNGG